MDVAGYLVSGLVCIAFGAIALYGERWQRSLENRRLRKHKCHTRCTESRWCACGCRDGLYGDKTGTRCVVCGTQVVVPPGNEITQEFPAPKGFTSWGWERDREFRKARRDIGE